ncbi:amino acid ABC transporter substrate-binding protein, PAAT family [Treponema bryantii]|uniref:Amino acid ABC transporter substrate-binding protein, PAAT family n=1 Tax=Treponema bryantii TaxID=163 RepID=A0A1H9JND7_9SPIR|nr:transporter substrate-binding domain-containing protein [Treponema bryantii]SEQ88289.1 amino acid ABC transporter substrate-binding protein, PAAT family [Treponema bryantii]
MKRELKITLAAALMMLAVTPCFAASKSKKSKTKVRTINVAHTVTNVPYDFLDEKGNADGFEIAVLKAVDEILPEYEFKFHGVSDEELLIGTESGKYQVGTKGAWITEERKKKFLIPQNPLAASVIGIAFRKENASQIKDLESFAKFSGKLIPISPQSAQFSVIQEFNDKHPSNQIKLVPSDVFDIADSYLWVLEGRYDAYFVLKLSFEKNVLKETGPYHQFADKLAYVPYKGIPTWPLFNKKETELAAAYDKAVQTLKENGTISALSLKYFGEDVFNFVSD